MYIISYINVPIIESTDILCIIELIILLTINLTLHINHLTPYCFNTIKITFLIQDNNDKIHCWSIRISSVMLLVLFVYSEIKIKCVWWRWIYQIIKNCVPNNTAFKIMCILDEDKKKVLLNNNNTNISTGDKYLIS